MSGEGKGLSRRLLGILVVGLAVVCAAVVVQVLGWLAGSGFSWLEGYIRRDLVDPVLRSVTSGLYFVITLGGIIAGLFTSVRLVTRGRTLAPHLLGLFVASLTVILTRSFRYSFGETISHTMPLLDLSWTGVVFTLPVCVAPVVFYAFAQRLGEELRDPTSRMTWSRQLVAATLALPLIGIGPMLLVASGSDALGGIGLLLTISFPLVVLAIVVAGVRRLGRARTEAEAAVRDHMTWIFSGFVLATFVMVAIALVTVNLFLQDFLDGLSPTRLRQDLFYLGPLFWVTPPALVLWYVATSVFYAGSIDPDMVLKRTTAYGALTTVFLFLFAGLERFVTQVAESVLALPEGFGVFLAGGLAAVAVAPLHARAKRVASRLVGDAAAEGSAASAGWPADRPPAPPPPSPPRYLR